MNIIDTNAVAEDFNGWYDRDPQYREKSPTHSAWIACWGVAQAYQDGTDTEISGTAMNLLIHALNKHNCNWSSSDLCDAIAQTIHNTVHIHKGH
tara:strand:- start:40612 stop:40893 length:282 start_codon:yes stop_codon:yes gene_type:complete